MPLIARIPVELSTDDVKALESQGISTVEDFLLADVTALRLPGLSECRQKEVLGQLFKYIHRNIASSPKNASDILLGPALQDTVPTGCAV